LFSPVQGNSSLHARSPSGFRPDGESAAHQPDALVHANQAQTSLLLDFREFKSVAGILNHKHDLFAAAGEGDVNSTRRSVFAGVAQAFMGESRLSHPFLARVAVQLCNTFGTREAG